MLYITDKQLRGHLAMWVCRQHPYRSVSGVDDVGALIDARAKADEWLGNDELRMKQFASWREVEGWLHSTICDHPQIQVWNTPKSGHTQEFVFSSRYGGPRPEDDFVDPHALVRNVALEAWRESERDHEFDKRADAKFAAELRGDDPLQ